MYARLISLFSIFFFLLIVSLSVTPVHAWDAVVVRVVDGDTLLVVPKDMQVPEEFGISIRLYGIDAPELKQPGGRDSRSTLEKLLVHRVLGKSSEIVKIIPMETDRYDRPVVLVMANGRLLNLEQIRSGQAWVYDKYCRARFCSNWNSAEKDARSHQRGLWAEEHPIPPWEWRGR